MLRVLLYRLIDQDVFAVLKVIVRVYHTCEFISCL